MQPFYKNYSPIMIGGLAIILYLFVALLFQPGEVDLTGPVHTDYYDYFVISQGKWSLGTWLTARPLMRAFLKIIGIVRQPELFYILLALPALLFLTILPYFVIRFELSRKSLLPLVAFYVVVFGSPFFSVHFQWDFGGMLSGFFATLAVFQGMIVLKDSDKSSDYWWFWTIFFALISIECKPTYSFAILASALLGAVFFNGRKSKIILLGIISIFIWVYVKDRYINPSPFLASSDSNSPYAVVISPLKNIEMLIFYLKNTFTLPLFLVTLISSFILVFYEKWKILIALVILTVATMAPLALLINRPQDTYAVFSTIIVGLIVMIAVSSVLDTFYESRVSSRSKTFLSIIAVFSIFIGLILHIGSPSNSTNLDWLIAQKKYTRNVITSLKLITEINGRKNLFAGLKGPFYPFRNTEFADFAFPSTGKYDVLLNRSEFELNKTYEVQKNTVYLNQINWADYSTIYIFADDGRLVGKFTTEEILEMSLTSRIILLYCGYTDNELTKNSNTVLKVLETLFNNQEVDATIEFGTTAISTGETSSWIYYFLAKAFMVKNDKNKALEFINKALEVEPNNPNFQSEQKVIQAGQVIEPTAITNK